MFRLTLLVLVLSCGAASAADQLSAYDHSQVTAYGNWLGRKVVWLILGVIIFVNRLIDWRIKREARRMQAEKKKTFIDYGQMPDLPPKPSNVDGLDR